MTKQTQSTRPSTSEIVIFVFAGLCVVLGVVVAPLTGGIGWIGLLIAAVLGWQGYRLRKERLHRTAAV